MKIVDVVIFASIFFMVMIFFEAYKMILFYREVQQRIDNRTLFKKIVTVRKC